MKTKTEKIDLSNHPNTTFTPPLKVGDMLITGICHHRDSMLVIHDYGATDQEYVSEGVKEEILKRLDEKTGNDINV